MGVHAGVWLSCCFLSATFRILFRAAICILGPSQESPPRRLPPASCDSIVELMESLPRVTLPPHLFDHSVTLAFAPCSNLCLYMFGAVACLQHAHNFADARQHFRFRGVSSGALVAAALALDTNLPALFEQCVGLLDTLNVRRWGWIGAYSCSIRELVKQAAQGKDIHTATAGGKLNIATTCFRPSPSLREITTFKNSSELEQAVLASCYIPVVWEDPIWLPDIGPCLDGGVSGFSVDGDFVFGPYHSNFPDVGPSAEYSRQLVFQPVDARDMLRLFEDGYRDCARWVEAGCPSRHAERQEKIFSQRAGGTCTMLREGWATFLEVSGIHEKRVS